MASGVNVVYIRNSVIEENVTIGYDKSSSEIGSFAGAINGYIENCVSYATVYGVDYVGGIAGRKAQTMGPCEVKNCSFEGSIEASGTYVGGIVGSGYAGGSGYNIDSAPNTPCVTIQNCYAAGTIKASDYVGGIFGGEPGLQGVLGQRHRIHSEQPLCRNDRVLGKP